MQVVILCSEAQREELGPVAPAVKFVQTPEALIRAEAEVYMDLLFEDNLAKHQPLLFPLVDKGVLVHAVMAQGLPPHWVRINAWPTFLSGPVAEVCGGMEANKERLSGALACLGKKAEWVPDVPGMVSARIIAGIINEAYYALSEGIATRQAIDTAMKLGTAYPFGPFEWAEKIGLHRVVGLLQQLSQTEQRYEPAPLLVEESRQFSKGTLPL